MFGFFGAGGGDGIIFSAFEGESSEISLRLPAEAFESRALDDRESTKE
jgi:hypothetical protein